jgi:hypothetical protein
VFLLPGSAKPKSVVFLGSRGPDRAPSDSASRAASGQAAALARGLFALLDWRIDTGMKADPQEMDDLFHAMAWSGANHHDSPPR